MTLRFFNRPRVDRREQARAQAREAVTSVVVVDECDAHPAWTRADARAALLRIAAEAVILQDEGAKVLAGVREREPLADLAPRGGPLARRFFELRSALPPAADEDTARLRQTLHEVLSHHGMLLVTALDMLAMDWRSPAIVTQLERLTGFGQPADRLEAAYAELAA